MAKVTDGVIHDGIVKLDYKFDVPLQNCIALEVGKVQLSEIFTHKGDSWQLHTTKVTYALKAKLNLLENEGPKFTSEGRSYLLHCQLQLVKSTNANKKVARIGCFFHGKIAQLSPVTTYSQPGEKSQSWPIWISDTKSDKVVIQVLKSNESEPSKSQRSVEVLKWFDSIDFGDVTLVAADGKEFGCHRDILERRSALLSHQMFTCEKIDSKENFIQIDGYSGDIVAQLLLFLYIDHVGEIGPIADRLYEAADKYKLDRLKSLCESAMAINLSANIIVKVYILATFHHLDNLVAKCVTYLNTNKADKTTADLLAEAFKLEGRNEGQKDEKK